MKHDQKGAMPTLAWMLKAPVAGWVKTRLAAELGAEAACAAYRRLVEHQAAQIPPGWRVVVHFDPPQAEAAVREWLGPRPDYQPQAEGHLGDRLAAAMAGHPFQCGSLFFIGGDCPYLDSGRLAAAAQALERADVEGVLVPAVDGGYVLMGLKAPQARLFEGIAWSTGQVLEQTLARAREAGLRMTLQPALEDVDDLASWRRAENFLNRR
jgi:rSAM/selenodomain-associated transferase 1